SGGIIARAREMILEGCADAEREEPHLIGRHRRHLAELRAGRVQGRSEPLLAVEHILRIDAELHCAAAAEAEAALDRQVRERQRHPADSVDAEREGTLLEGRWRFRGIALEAGIDI